MNLKIFTIKKQACFTILILLLVYAGSVLCSAFKTPGIYISGPGFRDSLYAGSSVCIGCHKTIYEGFIKTSHNITSRPASAGFIKGRFDSGHNFFRYNKFMDVAMEKNQEGFFQTSYINGEPSHREQMDVVIGSGKNGQTYLYWRDDILYQLPVSYHSGTQSWCNSPGYPPGLPRFDRVITGRCLECHGSYAAVEDVGNNINYIERNSVVYGVDCERCHGPAAEHVKFHTIHPEEKTGKHILTQQQLSRQQKLDLCALCHSGIREAIKPTFSYKAGDRLEDFSLPGYDVDSAAVLDVHGNQSGLLTSSKCFKVSQQMTCSSCHDLHNKEVNQPALFSQRCINCHSSPTHKQCSLKEKSGIRLEDNCIDCHMPMLPSKAIFLQVADRSKSTADFIRTHRITIYPDATAEFIRNLKEGKKKGKQ
jgi:hypothetical protein